MWEMPTEGIITEIFQISDDYQNLTIKQETQIDDELIKLIK